MWVRSQDNRLFNLNSIIYIDILSEGIYVNWGVGDDYKLLGKYANKKRCMEVLDGIHKHIENSGIVMYEYLHSESEKIEYTYKQRHVYEMPEE